MTDPLSREHALRLDREDELAPFRARFRIPAGRIYLDGNSLGLCSIDAEEALARALDSWRTLAIEGWTEADPPWFTLAEKLAGMVAPLVGAAAHEVIVANSTTVNLHQLLATFYRPAGRRRRIVVDALAFPSDAYAVASQVRLRGLDPAADLVFVGDRWSDRTVDEDAVLAALTDDVAFAVLPVVLYTTGQLLDVARITAVARERGVFLAWDLSHSVGAVPHRLHDWGCDAAFWCSYKYLNGGPGAAGGLFVHDRHFPQAHRTDAAARLRPGLAGWFGSDKSAQFEMEAHLVPAYGAGALQIGTPSLFAMAPLLGSLRTVAEAGIERLRAKSLRQTRYLMDLVRGRIPAEHGLGFANPEDDRRRGGHVALTHPEAERLAAALRSAGVVPDFRRPDIVRLAPVALSTTYAECFDAVDRLRDVLAHPDRWRGIATSSGVR